MLNMLLTSTQAAEEYEAEIPKFRDAVHLAWDDLMGKYNEPGWDNSCRSHVLQMQSVLHARQIFYGNSTVEYFTIDNRHVFLVRKKGLFHFKQFDEYHCTSNAETTAAKLFYSQSKLPGVDDYQRFAIGPIAKPDWTGYVGIFMAFPKAFREKPNWVLDITGKPTDIESLQNEFDESVFKPERRFRPKTQPAKRADGTGI